MSRVVYFDCASGASGDMLLGALVDLGLPLDELRAELARLPLAGYRLEARNVDRSGLHATKVDVLADASHAHAHRGLREILALARAQRAGAGAQAARVGAVPPAGGGGGRRPRHCPRTRSTSTRSAPSTPSWTWWGACAAWPGWAPSASWPRRSTSARAP